MFRALLKKQFAELNAFYFTDRKTGKLRSKGSAAGIIILYVFLFGMLAVMFLGLAFSLGTVLVGQGLDWLFFALISLIAIALGVFGSVFNTYAGLYHAKDNELLLSMPIPPAYILIVRMCGVCSMSLLYTSLVWLPACLWYILAGHASLLSAIFSLLLTLILTAFVSVLTCALGWVVALISGKLKNKSFITVIITLAFLAAYYAVYFRMNQILQAITENGAMLSNVVKRWIFPIWQLGLGAAGDPIGMLIFTAITAALFALTLFILSRSFTKIVTASDHGKKAAYRERAAKSVSASRALLGKELRRFTSSSTYMLNCGLGLILMPAAAIFAAFRADFLRGIFEEVFPAMPLLMVSTMMIFCCSMNAISAPSVSLEGKSLWIAQSLPVPARAVLAAKERLHLLLNGVPAFLSLIVVSVAFRFDILTVLSLLLAAAAIIWFCADFGLWLNLKHPTLDWTSEAVPVKQGIPAMVTVFVGMGISMVNAAGCALIPIGWIWEMFVAAVLGAIAFLLHRKVMTRGAELFENL